MRFKIDYTKKIEMIKAGKGYLAEYSFDLEKGGQK